MNYVIIGASASGMSFAKELRNLDKNCNITLISRDENVYSRCMLHHIISGHRTLKDINFVEDDFFNKYNITWLKGQTVNDLDVNKKILYTDKRSVKYDKLLIGSGAHAFIPPIKNLRESKSIYALRNIEDALSIKDALETKEKIAILGAGLVGVDVLVSLLEKNKKVSIIDMADRVLPLQLDKRSAKVYERKFIEKGASIYTSAKVEEVILDETNDPKAIKLQGGQIIECDMVIVATGVKPNIGFIREGSMEINRGIVTNDKCETSVENIYAIGDVRGVSPIWPLAMKEGKIAARNMVGGDERITDSFALRNSMNFLGVPTVSIGQVNPPDETYEVLTEEGSEYYKKIVYKDGVIYGVILQGEIDYCGAYIELIRNKIDVSHIKYDPFNIGYGDFFEISENGEYKFKAVV
ncbi:NAD(P)/FAD-dependent oxidoreductase [Anaeromicrobium sediminis]|uniref:Nitrate reductase n=1 Tax=Anaeromicrobium sediminis TaxID=1478221 RepID=A0A267MJZ2_9FIRM|nr:FAD-dependent oxidoreductase [Anaeromicrobium sediminis]PAB59904.1 nitrate reductase [Anaeromicrobium sediminis]